MSSVKLAMFRRRRLSSRVAWAVLLAFLFQQVAMAAYACPIETPPVPQVMMAGCEGMEIPDQAAPSLCEKHCNPDRSTTPDLRTAQVPPMALPPPHFDLAASLPPQMLAQYYQNVPTCRSDPPATERFCSLQI